MQPNEITFDPEKDLKDPPSLQDNHNLNTIKQSDNASVNGSVNGGCKYEVDSQSNWPKYDYVFQLKNCTSKDSPKEIARLLKQIFSQWPSKDGHWLWIAQRYTTRAINQQLSATIKQYLRGAIRKTPAIYFTFEIGFRKKRKLKHFKYKEGQNK